MAQETDEQLTTRSLVIRNEATLGANTKERHDDMNVALIDSKINNDKLDTDNLLATGGKTVPGRDAVKAYIAAALAALVDSSPGTLDTLNELAAALADDPNFSTTIINALATKVDEETFATLTFATPIVWNTDNRQSPLAKVTMTGSAAIDMTNVKNGSQGVLKITSSTASAFTLTFDISFTNKEATTNANLLTYTFPANNGAVYLLYYVADGSTLSWVVLDVATSTPDPFAHVTRAAAVSINNNDVTTAISFDTEVVDDSGIWAVGTPTRLVIPGSGNKLAIVRARCQWAINSTGVRRIWIYLNGVAHEFDQNFSGATTATIHSTVFEVACVGGDYIEIIPYQLSGAALSLDASTCKISIKNRI